MTTVAIFVDTQNVYYTVRDAYGKQFDYRRFWAAVTADREVLTARCYATDKGDARQRGFQNTLRTIGFEVKLKPFIQRADGSAKEVLGTDHSFCSTQSALTIKNRGLCARFLPARGARPYGTRARNLSDV